MHRLHSRLTIAGYGILLSGALLCSSPVFAADDALLNRVKAALEKHDYAAAEKELNAALAINSYDEAALAQKVRLLYFQGKTAEALALADTVLKEYPRNVEVLNVRGILRSASDPQRALEDFSAALQSNPSYYKALVNRARTWVKLGKNQEALADYDTAIKLAPDIGEIYSDRAALRILLVKSTEEKEALDQIRSDVDRALQANPEDGKALTTRGWYHWITHDDVQAFRSFLAAYQLDRDNLLAQRGLNNSTRSFLQATHDEATVATIWQDACTAFEKAHYDEASWKHLEWASALLCEKSGLKDNTPYETFRYLNSLLANEPQNVRLIYYRNAGYFRPENDAKLRGLVEGDARTRDARFTALAAIALARSEVVRATSLDLRSKEDYQNAFGWLRKAIDIVPDLPEASEMISAINARFQQIQQSKEEDKVREAKVAEDLQSVHSAYKQWESYMRNRMALAESKMKAARDFMQRSRQSPSKNDQYTLQRYNNEIREIYRDVNDRAEPVRNAIRKFRDTHSNLSSQTQQVLNAMSNALGDAAIAYDASKQQM